MAIHLNESIPVIYSAKVMEALQKLLVFGAIARRDFEGELRYGDRVIIRGYGDPTVGDYDGTAISWETIDDSAIQLDITERKYTAIKIDDVDKFQSDIAYMNRMAKKSAYFLAKKIDTTIAGLYSESPHAAVNTDADVDAATVIGDLTRHHTEMAQNDIPEGNMWIVVPPWVKDSLYMAGIYQANKTAGELVNGYMGNVLDMDMYVSTNCAGSYGSSEYIMSGSYDAIALVEQIKESDFFEKFEDTFGSGMRTLHVWGYKVVKPQELYYSDLTYTDESNL